MQFQRVLAHVCVCVIEHVRRWMLLLELHRFHKPPLSCFSSSVRFQSRVFPAIDATEANVAYGCCVLLCARVSLGTVLHLTSLRRVVVLICWWANVSRQILFPPPSPHPLKKTFHHDQYHDASLHYLLNTSRKSELI